MSLDEKINIADSTNFLCSAVSWILYAWKMRRKLLTVRIIVHISNLFETIRVPVIRKLFRIIITIYCCFAFLLAIIRWQRHRVRPSVVTASTVKWPQLLLTWLVVVDVEANGNDDASDNRKQKANNKTGNNTVAGCLIAQILQTAAMVLSVTNEYLKYEKIQSISLETGCNYRAIAGLDVVITALYSSGQSSTVRWTFWNHEKLFH